MYTDYKFLVLNLLSEKQYPVLLNHVVMDVYYKRLEPPPTAGERYSRRFHTPEVVYDRVNEPDTVVYMHSSGPNFFVHKVKDVRLDPIPTLCFKVRISKGLINQVLSTNHLTFEEEISDFIACLNSDVSRIKDILNLSFVESTCFVPVRIVTWVCDYRAVRVPDPCPENIATHFGPSKDPFDPRVVVGKRSACESSDNIISCREARALSESSLICNLPEELRLYDPYCLHLVTRYKSCVPLAYNPLENPIIVQDRCR